MIAVLALKRNSILLPDLAAAIMIQFQNTGPLTLALRLFHSRSHGRAKLLFSLGTILVITSTLLQFSSKILLFDFSIAPMTGSIQELVVPYGIRDISDIATNPEACMDYLGYCRSKPGGFPAFGEYLEPTSDEDEFHDTGLTMRTFLPVISETQRSILRDYRGPATVVDSRMVCVEQQF